MPIIDKIMIMKRCNLKIILLAGTILLSLFTIKAQQFKPNTEFGVLLGSSYYLGDLNTTHFNQPSVAAGLIIRRNIDKRFVYKAEVMYLNLRSDDNNPFNIRDSIDTTIKGLHFRRKNHA